MLKKTFLLLSIPISFVYLKAQDISVITNTVDVYSSNPINGTAKFNSMAGSIGALGGDISSANLNPAGIGVFITNDLNLTLGVHSNKNTTTFAGQALSNKINNTDIINTGGLLSFNLDALNSNWKFINVGVNYSTRSLDNYSNSAGNSNIKIVDDFSLPNQIINYTYRGHGYDRYGDQSKMNIAVGANYDNRLYFGAGLNFQTSFLRQFDSAAFLSDYDNTNLLYNKQYTGYEESADGFSANFGVIAKVSNQIRVGAALETPTWWSMDRVFSQYNFDQDDRTFGEDRRLVTPMKATLSAAFVPSKNLAINVDFIQGVTKPKYKVYGEAEQELNDFFDDSYKNSSEVRIGAEYRINAFRLRGGYAYQGNSFDNLSLLSYNDNGSTSNQSFSNLLVGKRNTIGAGLGYDFRAFYIDASYQNITSEYSSPFLQGNVDYNSGYFNGGFDVNSDAYAVSKVKNNRSNFFVTVGWKF
ncbi:OmpP1/FadL family transporter [Chryseobacterium sp. FH1]|uniref:OmpP1/FadL family transporter n=1 Tax=Chryseobacterium sp. FH1 TaxID=1233951 RepID=UPI0004E2B7B9|nr:hemin receptor [Chryseobacterium sp. FH1]KFC20520.1 hemin receptor [Chryseobacterium sp. FH1]